MAKRPESFPLMQQTPDRMRVGQEQIPPEILQEARREVWLPSDDDLLLLSSFGIAPVAASRRSLTVPRVSYQFHSGGKDWHIVTDLPSFADEEQAQQVLATVEGPWRGRLCGYGVGTAHDMQVLFPEDGPLVGGKAAIRWNRKIRYTETLYYLQRPMTDRVRSLPAGRMIEGVTVSGATVVFSNVMKNQPDPLPLR